MIFYIYIYIIIYKMILVFELILASQIGVNDNLNNHQKNILNKISSINKSCRVLTKSLYPCYFRRGRKSRSKAYKAYNRCLHYFSNIHTINISQTIKSRSMINPYPYGFIASIMYYHLLYNGKCLFIYLGYSHIIHTIMKLLGGIYRNDYKQINYICIEYLHFKRSGKATFGSHTLSAPQYAVYPTQNINWQDLYQYRIRFPPHMYGASPSRDPIPIIWIIGNYDTITSNFAMDILGYPYKYYSHTIITDDKESHFDHYSHYNDFNKKFAICDIKC